MFSLLLFCYWGGATARRRGEYVQWEEGRREVRIVNQARLNKTLRSKSINKLLPMTTLSTWRMRNVR